MSALETVYVSEQAPSNDRTYHLDLEGARITMSNEATFDHPGAVKVISGRLPGKSGETLDARSATVFRFRGSVPQ